MYRRHWAQSHRRRQRSPHSCMRACWRRASAWPKPPAPGLSFLPSRSSCPHPLRMHLYYRTSRTGAYRGGCDSRRLKGEPPEGTYDGSPADNAPASQPHRSSIYQTNPRKVAQATESQPCTSTSPSCARSVMSASSSARGTAPTASSNRRALPAPGRRSDAVRRSAAACRHAE